MPRWPLIDYYEPLRMACVMFSTVSFSNIYGHYPDSDDAMRLWWVNQAMSPTGKWDYRDYENGLWVSSSHWRPHRKSSDELLLDWLEKKEVGDVA